MSKLFKQLIYDTDWISQPGDPLTSPNGQVSVNANNDGTISTTSGGTTKQLATQDYVNTQIGNINAILDEINGEVI